jgi:flagellar motor switch protein FliM
MNLSDVTVPTSPQAIDPRTLGRPMHLLPTFAARFGADLSEFLRVGLNRRYGIGLEVESASMRRFVEHEAPARWDVYTAAAGRMGLSMPRSLVLRLLQCRYGLTEDKPLDAAESVAITASEERLAHKLTLQFATALAHRIEDGLAPTRTAAAPLSMTRGPETGLPPGAWRLEVWLVEPQRGERHLLQLCLDDTWMAHLLDQVGQGRTLTREHTTTPATPLAQRLKLRMVARLLQQRMPLGQVLDLRVGSVLPIPQPATVVLVKDSPLFTANVAEHKGRLWLTGFQDI